MWPWLEPPCPIPCPAALCPHQAAIMAGRRQQEQISPAEMEAALERVQVGAEKTNAVTSAARQKLVAYHEAGHALVGALMPNHDPVAKITIIPRGKVPPQRPRLLNPHPQRARPLRCPCVPTPIARGKARVAGAHTPSSEEGREGGRAVQEQSTEGGPVVHGGADGEGRAFPDVPRFCADSLHFVGPLEWCSVQGVTAFSGLCGRCATLSGPKRPDWLFVTTAM